MMHGQKKHQIIRFIVAGDINWPWKH